VLKDEQTASGELIRTVIGTTKADWVPLIHSFPVTKNYVVIPQFPVQMKMMQAMGSRDVMDGIEWMGDTQPAYLHVFDVNADKSSPPVKVFKADAFFAMHQINAYETVSASGSTVINFDCIAYDDAALMQNKYSFGNLELMKDPSCCANVTGSMKFRHYELDMVEEKGVKESTKVIHSKTNLWDSRINDEMLVELPRINDAYHGQKYCHFYTGANFPKHSLTNKDPYLVKADICKPGSVNGTYAVLSWHEDSHYTAEGVFVPRPGATEEDDGVVLSTVLDGTKNQTYLLVLDAKTMTPLAKVLSPVLIPYDVHGKFFPGRN